MVKICSKCKGEKEISAFQLDKKGLYGVKSICRKCRERKNLKTVYRNKRLSENITKAINRALKQNKENSYFKYFEFSLFQLKQYLEIYFKEEMTWDNLGENWGIDFIIPKRYFRYNRLNAEEFNKCFSLRNMRPLSIKEIRKKQGRLSWDEIKKYKIVDLLPEGPIIFNKEFLYDKDR